MSRHRPCTAGRPAPRFDSGTSARAVSRSGRAAKRGSGDGRYRTSPRHRGDAARRISAAGERSRRPPRWPPGRRSPDGPAHPLRLPPSPSRRRGASNSFTYRLLRLRRGGNQSFGPAPTGASPLTGSGSAPVSRSRKNQVRFHRCGRRGRTVSDPGDDRVAVTVRSGVGGLSARAGFLALLPDLLARTAS